MSLLLNMQDDIFQLLIPHEFGDDVPWEVLRAPGRPTAKRGGSMARRRKKGGGGGGRSGGGGKAPKQFDPRDTAREQGSQERETLGRKYELEAPYRLNEVGNEMAKIFGQYGGNDTEARRQFDQQFGQRQSEFDREFGQRGFEFGQTHSLDRDRYGLDRELGVGKLGLDRDRFGLESEIERGRLGYEGRRVGLEEELGRGRLNIEQEEWAQRVGLNERGMQLQEGEVSGYLRNPTGWQLTEDARARRMDEAARLGELRGEYIDPITGQSMGQTEGRRAGLEGEALRRGDLSGNMERYNSDTGRYEIVGETEERRQAKVDELQEVWNITGQIGGIDPTTGQMVYNGMLTDAAQQWRAQSAMDYARTAAQLQANPSDYFESAAFMRGAQNSGVPGFLDAINQNGLGSNMGFKTNTQMTLPKIGSMAQVAGGVPGAMPVDPNAMTQGRAVMPQVAGGDEMGYVGGTPGFYGGGPMDPARAAHLQQQMANQMTETAGMGMQEGPSASITSAQNAAAGQPAAYTKAMHQQMTPSVAQAMGQQGGMAGGYPAAPGFAQTLGMPTAGMDLAQQRLAAFQPTFQAGAHKLAPGAMESMTDTESALFGSAARASGLRPEDWEDQYNRSRIQTNVDPNRA